MKDNCSNHPKEVAGISDVKVLAEMIGNLHYEMLYELMNELAINLSRDGDKDYKEGRQHLGLYLIDAGAYCKTVSNYIYRAWQISKPFMEG